MVGNRNKSIESRQFVTNSAKERPNLSPWFRVECHLEGARVPFLRRAMCVNDGETMTNTPSLEERCESEEARAHPVIVAAAAYWTGLNGGRIPSRSQFEFMDIYQVAPHLLLSERVAPQTFTFIYCGTHVADNFPLDLTGKTFDPDKVKASRIPWFNYKSEALDEPCIRYGCDQFDWPNLDFNTILSGIFPLSDNDGVPRFSLACLVFLNQGDTAS
ncbi:MAG: PAS domain-containing protein [Alphaproteobacteria bacterium]|nr:PAS domain-containing protein [Alphaproteobacteria bacterium]